MKIAKPIFKLLTLLLTLVLLYNVIGSQSAQDELTPFFSLHLLVSTNKPVRMQYAQLLEAEFAKIGVDIDLDIVSWAAIGPRTYFDEAGTHLEGGYDMACIGMSLGVAAGYPGGNLRWIYHRDAIPPNGYNIMMWSNNSADYLTDRAGEQSDLIEKLLKETSQDEAKRMLKEWQKIFYDVSPQIMVLNEMDVHAVSPGLYGYDPITWPLYSAENLWLTSDYTGTVNEVVLGVTEAGINFFSFLDVAVYDRYVNGPIQDTLLGLTRSDETLLPDDVDRAAWMKTNFHDLYGTTGYMEAYSRIAATEGNYSPDGLNYTISIRDDVYFHDGHRLDAWDVAFSYQAQMTPEADPNLPAELIEIFGVDDKAAYAGNYSFPVKDVDGDGFYETISFILDDFYALFEVRNLVNYDILPEHILGDPINHGFDPLTGDYVGSPNWLVKAKDWKSHSMNTANSSDMGGYKGPIGAGPLIFYNYDPTSEEVTLKKFDGWMWDHTTKAWVKNATNRHFRAKDGQLDNMPETFTVVPKTEAEAIAGIKKGEVNIIDPWLVQNLVFEDIRDDPAITAVLSTKPGWQALYFNPKYADAAGVHHLKKKGVRHGLSHAIPREDIIEYLMHGQGEPGYTPVPFQSWGVIRPEEFLPYKKTVVATDGSRPEAGETTHYDSYNLSLALDWFETEGYDVQPYREALKGFSTSRGFFFPGFGIVIAFIACIGVGAFLSRKQR